MLKCSNCQTENPDTMRFCGGCGHVLNIQFVPPPRPKKINLLKIFVTIVILGSGGVIVLSIFNAISYTPQNNKSIKTFEASPKPTVKKVYTEPQIGMSQTDFEKLCVNYANDRTSQDRVTTFETATGKNYTYWHGYTEKRSRNHCWGTFSFAAGELESISR